MYGHDFAWYGGTVEEVFLSDPRGTGNDPAAVATITAPSSSSSTAVDKKKDKTITTKGKKDDKKEEPPSSSSSTSGNRMKEPFYFIRYDDGDEELCSRVKVRVPSWKERQPGILADGQIVHAKRADGQVPYPLIPHAIIYTP